MSLARVAVAGAAVVLSLSACGGAAPAPGGGSSAPAPASQPASAPASQAPASSAPASSAPATQGGGGAKPSTAPTELMLTGNVAGLNFTAISAADREKASGINAQAANAKIEPASCQKILKYAMATDPATTGSSMAQSGQSMYVSGVGVTSVSLKQMKTDFQGCPKLTMELAGQKVSMDIKVADLNVPGVTDGYTVQQTMSLAGQTINQYVNNGTVRGLMVSVSTVNGDQAKVQEAFKAQVDKVTKAK